MNFDAQKFFIGLMDFFAIILPGAALTFFLMGDVAPLLVPDAAARERIEGYGVALFLFSSYLVGHLIFLLGAWLLDDVYDWARRHTLNAQVRDLALRDRLLPWPTRVLVWMLFRRENNSAVWRAARIKEKQLESLQAADAVNTFQWSKAWLAAESPESLATVQRFEADSKFFRSFVLVLFILALLWGVRALCGVTGQWELFVGALILLPLALWRYADQRLKSTNQAYWSVITLTARADKLRISPYKTASGEPTHAGGVVFRGDGANVKYLLVEATKQPNEWVLPKGHREAREHVRETAVREVHEECGVWGRIVDDLGVVTLPTEGGPVSVHFLLMERVGRGRRKEVERESDWFSLDDACAKTPFKETRELLRRADTTRGQRTKRKS